MGELLTIELVPQSCWYSNVRSHVTPEEWEGLKRITFKRAGYVCEICGGRGPRWPVEAHESWVYDDGRHIQKLVGLVALCPDCHEVKHMGLANVRGRREAATGHLAKVNNWSLETSQVYVEECFKVWMQRSEFQWELDISYLKMYGIEIANEVSHVSRM